MVLRTEGVIDLANEEMKKRILAYVCDYADQNGFAPSYREIQQAIGAKSVSTVHDYVKRLEAEGRLDMKAKHPRALSTNRRIQLQANSAQRVRVEVADGGVLFLDCSLERTGTDGMAFAISGVMDARQLKGPVGSVVGCTIEDE